jgi:hypothetical protein
LPLPTSALTTALIVPREDLPPPTH